METQIVTEILPFSRLYADPIVLFSRPYLSLYWCVFAQFLTLQWLHLQGGIARNWVCSWQRRATCSYLPTLVFQGDASFTPIKIALPELRRNIFQNYSFFLVPLDMVRWGCSDCCRQCDSCSGQDALNPYMTKRPKLNLLNFWRLGVGHIRTFSCSIILNFLANTCNVLHFFYWYQIWPFLNYISHRMVIQVGHFETMKSWFFNGSNTVWNVCNANLKRVVYNLLYCFQWLIWLLFLMRSGFIRNSPECFEIDSTSTATIWSGYWRQLVLRWKYYLRQLQV